MAISQERRNTSVWHNTEHLSNALELTGQLEVSNKSEFDVAFVSIVEEFNRSILKGEYINQDLQSTKLQEISNCISSIYSENDDLGVEEVEKKLRTLNWCCETYQNFGEEIFYTFHFTPIASFAWDRRFSYRSYGLDSNPQVKLFEYNLLASVQDFNLSTSDRCLSALLKLKSQVQNIRPADEIRNLILAKVEFLLKKIYYRFKKDSKQTNKEELGFLLNGKFFSGEEINIELFNEFDQLILGHYGLDTSNSYKYKESLAAIAKTLVDEDSSELLIRDYHSLVKYFRNVDPSPNEVDRCLSKFKALYHSDYNDSDKKFNERALDITFNYLLNNYLSAYLNKKVEHKIDQNKIDEILIEINNLQKKTGVKNFFPHIKYCNYLLEILQEKMQMDVLSKDEVKTCKEYLDQFQTYLEKAEKAVNWCIDYNFMHFQLPYEECFSGNIFLKSSFVIPINFYSERHTIFKLRNKLSLINNQLKTIEKNAELHKVYSEIKSKEKGYIEILSVFAAIVLFVSGSIQVFSRGDVTYENALLFIYVFALSISSFLIVVVLITNDYWKGKIAPYILAVVYFILSLIVIFKITDQNSKEVKPRDINTTGAHK